MILIAWLLISISLIFLGSTLMWYERLRKIELNRTHHCKDCHTTLYGRELYEAKIRSINSLEGREV